MAKLPAPFAVLDKLLDREQELGEFIAGPDAGGLRGWVQDKYRHRCRELSNVPGWARALGGFAFGSASRICEPYWDENGWSAPTNDVPFTGGQCEGVNYEVTIVSTSYPFSDCSNLGPGTSTNTFQGPIRGLRFAVENPSGELCTPGRNVAYLQYGNPMTEVLAAGGGFGVDASITSVVRADGQPDDCGDPEPIREPGPTPAPDPGPLPGPEPTDDPNDPTGPPLFPIPPYDDPLGGPVDIVAEPDPTGPGLEPTDIPGNPDTSPGGGDDVAEPINVDPGPGGGGNETNFGEPPDGRVWVGCMLRFTFPSSIGAIAGSGPANPVTPRVVGNASLVFEGGRGDAFQVRSGSMVIVRPTGALRVTGVYVNSDPGITYTIRPLSLKKCPDNECSSE